ncbi:MAG: NADH-quinone oxidoreductase subunit N [Acidimicrobiales bacterium]
MPATASGTRCSSLSAAGTVTMASASDASELVLGVMLSSSTGYVLAAYHRRSALSVEAGAKYFLGGALTNAFLLVGIVLVIGAAGTTLYAPVAASLASASTITLSAAAVLVTVGLAFKLGAFPAHSWVPDVAQGTPAPAAAFLTVAPKVGGLVALARLLSLVPDTTVAWRPLLAVIAALTMTIGNLGALWQSDLRRLLGWSSISQVGYALMAVVVVGRSPHALPALLYFLAACAAAQFGGVRRGHRVAGPDRSGRLRGSGAAASLARCRSRPRPPLLRRHTPSGRVRREAAAVLGGDRRGIRVARSGGGGQHRRLGLLLSAGHRSRRARREPTSGTGPGSLAAAGTAAASVLVIALGVGAQALIQPASHSGLLS